MQDIFNRVELLLGTEALKKIQSKRVIIFGVGGVGSWCAESLVRTGIQHLTIVDPDVVCESNINRQLEATTKTIGCPKVETLKERLLEINPNVEITVLQEQYTQLSALNSQLSTFDYIIDCIDSLKDKAELLVNATMASTGSPTGYPKVYSSMGAALKVDPTQIRVAEFWKVRECPLGAALRKKIKRSGLSLAQKVQCVYSVEKPLPNQGNSDNADGSMTFNKTQTNGSLSHITAIFGFTLAGLVIQDILRQAQQP